MMLFKKIRKAYMSHTFIIIDDHKEDVLKTLSIAGRFRNLSFVAMAHTYEEGLNLILEHQPKLIFLEIDPTDKQSRLSLALINELYRYLTVVPKIVITTKNSGFAYEALKYEVVDYLLKPLHLNDFRKTILKFERALNSDVKPIEIPNLGDVYEVLDETIVVEPEIGNMSTKELEVEITPTQDEIEQNTDNITVVPEIEIDSNIDVDDDTNQTIESDEYKDSVQTISAVEIPDSETELDSETIDNTLIIEKPIVIQQEQSLVICIKSYGDYRYIDSEEILYFEADNNSTDIHLNNGEMITAFKTLKHFETVLPHSQFLRIHNSYIINISQVSRIHTGNTVCYIKNSATKLPFSKSYKENVDLIINQIAGGNYLEI